MIRILRIYIGATETMDTPLSDRQWETVFQKAVRQSLQGVFYEAVKALPPPLSPPMTVRIRSAFMAEAIAGGNDLLNRHCREITEQMHRMGFGCCVLKGQGMAALYPHPETRACGDIDLWVSGDTKEILTALRSRWRTGMVCYHHTDIRPFGDDTEVEIHFRPSWMNDPFTDRKLQKYFRSQADRQFRNRAAGPDFPVPDIAFNCVFCAVHIYRHLLQEGIGLRQVMDFYYVLRHSTPEDRAATAAVLSDLRMRRFTGALMYVLREWFLLDEGLLIVPPDGKYGRFLMNEIRLAGNFGHYDTRYSIRDSDPLLRRGVKKMMRLSHFMAIAPSEVLWAPVFKIWQHVWRRAIN